MAECRSGRSTSVSVMSTTMPASEMSFGANSEAIDDDDHNQQHQMFLSSSSIIVLQPGSFNLYYGLVGIDTII